MKKLLLVLLVLLLLVPAFLHYSYLPSRAKAMNPTLNAPPYAASTAAKALHQMLRVADMHADSLLWGRDLNQRSAWGHVDVPRLLEGNVVLQGFTVVTKVPQNMNIESNTGDSDQIRLLSVASFWPPSAWSSLTERALHQAALLHKYAAASGGKLTIIKSQADMFQYMERRKQDPHITAGFLGIEGAHALDGKLENLDRLYAAGYRMIGLAHFFDNEFAGSAHGVTKGGLTPLGKQLVEKLEEKKMFIDLAHASPAVINDVLKLARRPVLVSHTGVRATCDNARNLSDEQLKRISDSAGVVGIGFWDTATCGKDAKAIAQAIRHAVDVMGVDHVALGSDFDGAIAAPFDATGLVQITDALLQEKFSEADIRKIMGENVIRTLQFFLP
ncbi:MAG: dipeptidase [Acidobacteria bacterium]|nr:dipeptidase [Acidobacteriota bacterium]MBI3423595.1 dipeptidase [Acidobacteriota bacterium]